MSNTARLAPSFLPATAVLEMTYRCNHACLFCSCPWYAGAIPEDPEMPVAELQCVYVVPVQLTEAVSL